MARIRVVLADDHRLMLETVEAILDADGDFEVVGSVQSGAELLSVVARTEPDVAVLDVAMPGVGGLECLQWIRARHPRVKVVMLSGASDPRIAQRSLRLGASAFVRKDVDPRDLGAILRQTLEETVAAHPAELRAADDRLDALRTMLTPTELAVLEALARGLVNTQIAADLGMAQQTVKFHLTNVYRKLGVTNRTEAIGYAFEAGLADGALAPA